MLKMVIASNRPITYKTSMKKHKVYKLMSKLSNSALIKE